MILDGYGTEQIASIFESEGILTPRAYWLKKEIRKPGRAKQQPSTKWNASTIVNILTLQEYCGDVLNFKTYSKSFRNKTRIDNPQENWAVFRDVHEPIIDRETFERVRQIVGKVKQRHLKNPGEEKSIFTNFLYCADCGSRMWFHKSTNKVPVRHFFCSNYKGMRGTCNDHHYIREDALTEVVLSELRRLAAFLACDEDAFAELLRQKTDADMMAEQKRLEAGLAAAQARNAEVLKLYERIYEDNVNGKVSDEWFMQLSKKYEEEKAELKKQIFDLTERLNRLSGMQTAKDGFLRAIRSFMQMETLTPTVLHELVERIDIHAVQGRGKNRTQKIVIHYQFVGVIDVPYVQKTPVLMETRQGVAIRYVSGEQTA